MNPYLIQQYLDNTSEQMRDATAVYCESKSISFEELNLSSNKLANCLKRNGVKRGDRVLYILPKTIDSIYALISILKADAIYVPIDAESPIARTIEIIQDCSPSAIICDSSAFERTRKLLEIVDLEFKILVIGSNNNNSSVDNEIIFQNDIDEEKSEFPIYMNIESDLAYILYTSGSTGKPKGVMVSHRSVLNYIDWAVDYFRISHSDNLLNTSPLHFDMSVFDIFCSLKAGASLTLVPKRVQLFPIKLIETMEKRKISIWKAVSSLLSYFVKTNAVKKERLKYLRKIIFSGEVLPTKYLIEWMKTYPKKEFYNAYGPSESTGISTCYKIPHIPSNSSEYIPIGKSCTNTEVFAVTEDGEISDVGVIGELCIRGTCLSNGYWNDTKKTEYSFKVNKNNDHFKERIYHTGDLVKLLSTGDYLFIGRKDQQIKHMGYRIELGEIEASLHDIEGVKDAAVIAVGFEYQENPEIIAFVELTNTVQVGFINEKLRTKLPTYMVPHKTNVLKKIPRTKNGKFDRQYLKTIYLDEKNNIA